MLDKSNYNIKYKKSRNKFISVDFPIVTISHINYYY